MWHRIGRVVLWYKFHDGEGDIIGAYMENLPMDKRGNGLAQPIKQFIIPMDKRGNGKAQIVGAPTVTIK